MPKRPIRDAEATGFAPLGPRAELSRASHCTCTSASYGTPFTANPTNRQLCRHPTPPHARRSLDCFPESPALPPRYLSCQSPRYSHPGVNGSDPVKSPPLSSAGLWLHTLTRRLKAPSRRHEEMVAAWAAGRTGRSCICSRSSAGAAHTPAPPERVLTKSAGPARGT